jgi:hypothetical protein
VDLDTSTTTAVPDLHQPLTSTSLFTLVSLHKTFLLIKPENRLPSDRSITAPCSLHPTFNLIYRH